MSYIKEDALKGCLSIGNISYKILINSVTNNVCLFVYIYYLCFSVYIFISILSWFLKLEQSTPFYWLYDAYVKVSSILYSVLVGPPLISIIKGNIYISVPFYLVAL